MRCDFWNYNCSDYNIYRSLHLDGHAWCEVSVFDFSNLIRP